MEKRGVSDMHEYLQGIGISGIKEIGRNIEREILVSTKRSISINTPTGKMVVRVSLIDYIKRALFRKKLLRDLDKK